MSRTKEFYHEEICRGFADLEDEEYFYDSAFEKDVEESLDQIQEDIDLSQLPSWMHPKS